MPNPRRGEIEALLDGTPFNLVLTLGALAELEQAFGHEDMLWLAERFQTGRLSAVDAQRIIGAGLRGAGHEIADEAVGRMQADGGAAGFVDIVARLLGATFGGPEAPMAAGRRPAAFSAPAIAGSPSPAGAPAEGRAAPDPFPGTP
jgi:hypothetical protein